MAKRHSVHDGWHISAVCGELLYSPSVQRLFLGLLQQSNDGRRGIRDHLSIQVRLDDGLPHHVCPKCKRELQALERAAEGSGEQRQQGRCLPSFLSNMNGKQINFPDLGIMWRERTQRAITPGSHTSACTVTPAVTRYATPPISICTCMRGC